MAGCSFARVRASRRPRRAARREQLHLDRDDLVVIDDELPVDGHIPVRLDVQRGWTDDRAYVDEGGGCQRQGRPVERRASASRGDPEPQDADVLAYDLQRGASVREVFGRGAAVVGQEAAQVLLGGRRTRPCASGRPPG